jgi:hypothetical protein
MRGAESSRDVQHQADALNGKVRKVVTASQNDRYEAVRVAEEISSNKQVWGNGCTHSRPRASE